MTTDHRPRDGGGQLERTLLGWHRTTLAALANAALLVRAGVIDHRAWPVALGICVAAVALLADATAAHRYARGPAARSGLLVRTELVPAIAVLLTVATATTALWLAVE